LLTIALLLVPLNFLAAIALSEQRPATDPLYLTAVAIGVAAYGWITWSGSRELMHFGASWLTLAVLGSAIGQLVIGRRTSAGLSTIELSELFGLPLGSYVVALLGTSHFAARWQRLTPRRIESLYRLLGIAFFSFCVALGLLLWKSQAVLDTLSRLSPCVSLAAAMIVGVAGRLLPQRSGTALLPFPRIGGEGPLQKSSRVGTSSRDIAATAVALIGAMLMVVAVVLAWPNPERLIAVGVVNFLALSWFGFATGLAPLHVPALGSLALAGLIAFHRYGEAIGGASLSENQTLFATILLGRSSVVVALMSLLTAAAASFVVPPLGGIFSHRRNAPPEGGTTNSYLVAAAGMALLSLGIAGYAGFWPQLSQPSIDRSLPTIVFVLFGIVGMIANERLNRIEVAWAGAAVWLAAFLHAFGWNTHLRDWLTSVDLLPSRPIVVALLSFATWSLGCAMVGKIRNRFVAPWSAASGRAVVVALFALPWKVWGDFGPHAIYLGWIATLCLGQAHLWQSRNLFSLSQALAFIATSLGVTAVAQHQEWWLASHDDVRAFRDVRHWHWQLVGLALACVPWVLWRRFGGRFAVLARCSDWKLDRVVLPTVVLASALTMWFSIWPFLGFERYQHSEFWPVVMQGWRTRVWDRVLLWLIGWGAVTWSLEEVCRRWAQRGRGQEPSSSAAVCFPWMAALGTLAIGALLFAIPQLVWFGIPLARRHSAADPSVLFGWSMWCVAGAGLIASGLSFLERGRWQVRVLVVACWVALWQVAWIGLTDTVRNFRSWTHKLPWLGWLDDGIFNWLTLIGFGLLVVGGFMDWLVRRIAWAGSQRRSASIRDDVWGVVGWLCLLPVIVLAPQVSIGGAISETTSLLFCWACVLVWRAWRMRSAAVAFGASHAWCWVFAANALMWPVEDLVRNYLPDPETVFVRFLLWSAVALGAFSQLWVRASWRRRWGPLQPAWWDWRGDLATITPWLWQQHWSWACLLLSSLFAAWTLLRRVMFHEAHQSPFSEPAAHFAFVLVAFSSFLAARRWRYRWHTAGLASFAWVPVFAAGCEAVEFTSWLGGTWKTFHLWQAGWLTLAVAWSAGRSVTALATMRNSSGSESLTPALSRAKREKYAAMTLWSDVASFGVLVLAAREFVAHQSVLWPAACVAVIALTTAALALVSRSQGRVAASIFCTVLATAMAWTRDWDGLRARNERQVFWWLEASVTALAVAACAWQAVEVWWQARRGERFDPSSRFTTAELSSRFAFDAALSIVLLVTLGQLLGRGWSIHELGGWVMVLAISASFVVSWCDRFATRTISGAYGSLWLLLLMVLDSRGLSLGDRWVTWLAGLIAMDVGLVGVAWWVSKRSLSAVWRERQTEAERWLLDAQLVFAVAASVLVILGVLTFDDRSLRLWNVASAAMLVPGIALTARSQQRARLQRVALALGAAWAVEFLWAWMEPRPQADFWLQRSIRALEALAVMAFVYGAGLARWIRFDSDWRVAVEREARDVAFVAIATLLIVLGLEAWWFDPTNGAPVTGLQIAFVAAALIGLAAALLVMALSKHRPETAEPSAFVAPQALVYAAEILMGLLFLHVYLTMPELFRGYFRPYWPLIVMAIAFAGVGVSELCQRAKLKVLSKPFEHSAALLPLIPALGFWIATSRLDYSTVLFLAGLVYVWLNLRRRSFWYVLAASLAGNAGLWSLWSEHGVELLVRPQVWLIPPSVSVLAAAQWNRRRLTEAQLAAIRYPAITLLYVSSAGEMFLTGIAESFWLPIVLMVLSVLGVLAGIWLRVRAFLYLGTSFLLLSLVSMVWHAAEAIDHIWPWWAFGIGLGLGVLTLFGLFERRRNEMLRLLGELRTWER
jgi:hypothetical protein